MKSFSDLRKVQEKVKHQEVRDQYYREEIYKQGEWVITEKDQVGRIIRRGPNYVICLTAEDTKFRTWVKDIKEVFEIGTDAYRQYVMSLTPGQKVQKPEGTVKVKQIIPTDPKKDKMDHHEEKTLVQSAVEQLHKDLRREWRFDKGNEPLGNKDVKGKGASGIGGGDAPGMKLAEPKGTKGAPKVKKPQHACATKVEHAEWGEGNCLKGEHTLTEDGKVSHYDIMFEHGIEKNVPVQTLNIIDEAIHEHAINHDKNAEVLEHHQKDADGKVIEHDETTPSSVEEGFKNREQEKAAYANGYKKKVKKESFSSWRAIAEKK